MKAEQQEERQGITHNNEGYNEYNALQLRLDTNPILSQIESYLRGVEERVHIDEHGEPKYYLEEVSNPKANKNGVHSIMAWLRSTLNPQVVQGNFQNFEDVSNYLYNYRLDLAEYIMKNLHNWEVKREDFEGIIDMILIQVKPFMTRLVGNKERESYSSTIQHKETNSSQLREQSRKAFQIPGLPGM